MKTLYERRRQSVYLRIAAGTILAIFIWTVFGLVPACSLDDPDCGLLFPSPHFENDWIDEPLAGVLDSETSLLEAEERVEMNLDQERQPQNTVSPSTWPVHTQLADETSFVAHASGFSVIESAFWRNDTWIFITSKPWSFPPMSLVISNAPDHGQKIFTDDSVVKVMSRNEAKEAGLELDAAEAVDGTSVSMRACRLGEVLTCMCNS